MMKRDKVTPLTDVLKVKAENYPNIEFVITKGLGHRRIYRDNKVSKAIIDFCDNVLYKTHERTRKIVAAQQSLKPLRKTLYSLR